LLLLFSKYIRWHLVKCGHIYNKVAVRIKWPLVFCFLFNLRARIKKKDVRFYYNKIEDIFIAKSQKYEKKFFSKYQNYNCYKNGIEERGISLGKTYFLDKIKFSDNNTIIDCGANIGDLKIYFDNKKLNINYIGIEPSSKEYYCLSKNVAPSMTYNIGLWNENSNLDFYVSSHNADSSFIKPMTYSEKILISSKRLDSFFDKNIRLLKIEAEGAEPEVLIGCKKLLTKIDYISADLGFERGVLRESTLVPVTNFLLKNNFELLDFSSPRICALYKRIGIEY
jgi:FkbM family methyltransferase